MEEREQEFLWGLVLQWMKGLGSVDTQPQLNLYDRELHFPSELEDLVLNIRTPSDLAEACLWLVKRFSFEPDKHLALLSVLYGRSMISLEEVEQLIPAPEQIHIGLPAHLRKIVDVGWLHRQDALHGGSTDDSLLRQALVQAMDIEAVGPRARG